MSRSENYRIPTLVISQRIYIYQLINKILVYTCRYLHTQRNKICTRSFRSTLNVLNLQKSLHFLGLKLQEFS